MNQFEPQYDNLMSEFGVNELLRQASKFETFEKYFRSVEHRVNRSDLVGLVTQIAEYVEPRDPALGADKVNPAENAFLAGSLPAITQVETFLNPGISRRMVRDHGQPFLNMIKDLPPEPEKEELFEVGSAIVESSERGWAQVKPYHETIKQWSEIIDNEVRYQPFVRRGFGFVMGLAIDAHSVVMAEDLADIDFQHMSGEAGTMADWDQEYAKLLSEEL